MTISYELAKRLKDAGFPQLHEADPKGEGKKLISDNLADNMEIDAGIVYAPTLSELIEWCGNDFYGLFKDQENNRVSYLGWKATGMTNLHVDSRLHGEGRTPEVAVAELGIKLHNKRNGTQI